MNSGFNINFMYVKCLLQALFMTEVQGGLEQHTLQIMTMKRTCVSVCYCSY